VLGPAIKGVTIRGGEERLARVLNPDVGGAGSRLGRVNFCEKFSSSPVQSSQGFFSPLIQADDGSDRADGRKAKA
jgi:hypothetical protein